MIDRNNCLDAEDCINVFIDSRNQEIILSFLGQLIEFADRLDNSNWNLNLDLYGKFLRFNVGQEYCLEIRKTGILVLSIRSTIPEKIKKQRGSIEYLGFYQKEAIKSYKISDVPDCLAKVPGSIGCIIKTDFKYYFELLKSSIYEFIDYSIKHTKILPKMISAHSVGSIIFLSEFLEKEIPNPSFVLKAIKINELSNIKKIQNLSTSRLRELADKTKAAPSKITTKSTAFIRNPYVAELSKRLAGGACQNCKQPAPFINRFTKEHYLETHHIIPLSEGGEDTIGNVIALCPNCHRKGHYG